MEPSACPVCTLYLREGISLYNHLDTHPKEQVIEALIRSQQVQSQHLVTAPTTQATPFYQTPPQCFPVQQFSGNSFTYQQILPNSGMNSSIAPVTMLMPPNSNPNLMQMIYNPFLMQQQQQQQVQLVNSPNNVPIQQTPLQRNVYSNPNGNPDSRQVLQSSDPVPVQINTPVSDHFAKAQPRCHANTPVKGVITALPAQTQNYSYLPNKVRPLRPATCHAEMPAPQSTVSTGPIPNEHSSAGSSKLPILKFTHDMATGKPGVNRSNKIQIVHILPSTGNPNVNSPRINHIVMPKIETTTHWPTSEEVKVTQTSNNRPQNLITELRDLIANKSIELTPLRSQPVSPENDNSVMILPSTSVDSKDEIPKSSKMGLVNKRKRSLSSSISNTMKRSTPPNMRHECMDIELSRIDLTDLAEKDYYASQPGGSREQELEMGLTSIEREHELIYAEESQDYPTDISCASEQKSISPELEVRRHSINEEDDYANLDSKTNIELLSAGGHEYDQSLSPSSDHKSGRTSPALSYESRTESGSPGLRIRTDLSNKSVHAFPTDSLSRSREEMINDFLEDSNVAANFVDIVPSNLRIQLPPISATDNDEYITSDCGCPTNDAEVNHEDGTPSPVAASSPRSRFSNGNDESGNCTETTRYESGSPINIIEIDGIHIMVPSQFYEKPGIDGSQDDIDMVTSELELQKVEPSAEPNAEPELDCKRDVIRDSRELAIQSDDMNVSTSYDLLARESWGESDGSDNEGNADCNISAIDHSWEDIVESRPIVEKRIGRGRLSKIHKCAVCSMTFNCPKELRVHRSTHVSDKVVASETESVPAEATIVSNEPPAMKEERVTAVRTRRKVKRVVKKVVKKVNGRVLFVKNEAYKFMGVFVEEDGIALEDDVERKADPIVFPGGSEIKTEPAAIKVEKALKCLSCPELFSMRKYLIRHIRLDHSTVDGKHMCDTCQEIFAEEADYNIHLKKHPLECRSCSKNFYRRQNLQLHMKRHLGIKPHVCVVCSKAFITKQKLSEHLNVHSGLAPIKCPLCPLGFRRYSNLIQHKNRFHLKLKKKVKDYVCFCGDIFHSRKKLEWHKEIHERKPKCCTFCSERFVHSASLTRHVRRAHDRRYMPKVGREGENVECSICGHVFLKSSLLVHMRLHSGERPFSCAVCNKQFTTKWNLQQHRWTHTSRSNKPFKCTLCKSAFSRESDFTQHMDSHRNKRQYTCNVCGEQFVRKNNCQRHVKEHEAEKLFACKECGKKFHRNYYLKDHMRVHSGARPFSCHICGKASSTKSNHNKHVKIHHAREPVNTES